MLNRLSKCATQNLSKVARRNASISATPLLSSRYYQSKYHAQTSWKFNLGVAISGITLAALIELEKGKHNTAKCESEDSATDNAAAASPVASPVAAQPLAKKEPIRVMISGAAGQIGYSLIPLFANGLVFGPDQPIILHLLEIEPALKALSGVALEVKDGAYPLVKDIVITAQASEAFKDIDYAVLVGGFPRKAGMLRKDLLAKNAPIFKAMGTGLEEHAKDSCKVLVVANPANTNCLTAATNAPKIPKENFCALTRLDANRARAQLAEKLDVEVADVTNVVIWGNHSATQVPDVNNAMVSCDGLLSSVDVDNEWVRGDFTKRVQQRGKEVIQARGLSSAMSAANGAKDCLRDWVNGTNAGEHVAMAVYSDGSYGVAKDIFYSFPCVTRDGEWSIVEDLTVTEDVLELMKATEAELLDEKKEAGIQ